MINYVKKFELIVELLELSERAFLYKLKKRKPDLSPDQIKEELRNWYQTRPGAEHGDGVGVPGNPSRFD